MSEQTESLKKRKIEDVEPTCSAEDEEIKSKIAKAENSNNSTLSESIETNTSTDDSTTTTEVKKGINEDGKNVEDDKKSTEYVKPKSGFVFGSTTPFGNMGGFKMFGGGSTKSFGNTQATPNEVKDEVKEDSKTDIEIETTKADSETIETKTDEKSEDSRKSTTKSVFGSGSTFGNAFQAAINKKSVFEDLKPKSAESTKDDENSDETTAKDVYKKVDLEKQDVKSGEENEENIFQIKAKVYQMELSDSKLGWKERGFGILKVNKFEKAISDQYTSRIVMRQNGNFKLILNVPIVKGFKVLKGIPSSLSADKFIRFQMIEEGKPVQYAIKVGQPENAEKLYGAIVKQVPQ